jgi:hypothetical protein
VEIKRALFDVKPNRNGENDAKIENIKAKRTDVFSERRVLILNKPEFKIFATRKISKTSTKRYCTFSTRLVRFPSMSKRAKTALIML